MATIQPSGAQADLGFPIDADFMFSDAKGRYAPRREKRQRKLARSAPFLSRFLEPGERVLLFCTGCSPISVMDQLLTGAIIFSLKRAVFVCTDRRVFHVPSTRSFAYRDSIAQIRYADCESVRMSWRTLKVKYNNGGTEKFYYIGGPDRGKLKQFVGRIALPGAQTATPGRSHLCPRCAAALIADAYACPKCNLEFKSPQEGAKLSWLVPGGGYFYTGHPWLGAMDAVVELYLLLLLAVGVADMSRAVEGAGAIVAVVAVLLTIEKLISVYHSNHFLKEFIPKEKMAAGTLSARAV